MTGWTHLGAELPWLRGQGIHLAGQSSLPLVRRSLTAAGFTVVAGALAAGPGRYQGVGSALRLPATVGSSLDALADALRELPTRWPDVGRLALLMPDSAVLIRADLLAWTELSLVLRQAGIELWSGHRLLFESVAFVDDGDFGADQPA
ncbi:MAG: barstar family protein [Jatrophihabitans sp.]